MDRPLTLCILINVATLERVAAADLRARLAGGGRFSSSWSMLEAEFGDVNKYLKAYCGFQNDHL